MSDRYLVRAAIAPLQAGPRAGSEQVSQRARGHVLQLLEECSPWLRMRGADDYEGWVHIGYLEALTPALRSRFAHGRVSLGCTIVQSDGRRRTLPLGAIVAGDELLERGMALGESEMRARFPASVESITRSALELFDGTPYQWGGVTPWGADCSGLVQTVFALHGIGMPRDAREQARTGEEVNASIGDARAGDLLFFSDRPDQRITHVAISLGDMRIVHLALGRGGYAVERLDAPGDPYVSALLERFVHLRRPELPGS